MFGAGLLFSVPSKQLSPSNGTHVWSARATQSAASGRATVSPAQTGHPVFRIGRPLGINLTALRSLEDLVCSHTPPDHEIDMSRKKPGSLCPCFKSNKCSSLQDREFDVSKMNLGTLDFTQVELGNVARFFISGIRTTTASPATPVKNSAKNRWARRGGGALSRRSREAPGEFLP